MPEPAFIDHKDVAAMLGLSPDTLYRKRAKLVKTGFPERHKLIGKYLKADVEAWLETQRTIEAAAKVPTASGFNYDAL